jgi:hypothetical protein
MKDKGFSLIFKAIDVSLDLRKLLTTVVGLAVTFAVAALFGFLGNRTGVGGGIFFGLLSLIAIWVGFSLVYGTVTRMSYLHLHDGNPGSWRNAFSYAVDHWPSLMFTGLVLALSVIGVFVAEIILMLLGRIPYLGELLASAAFLPLTLVNAFVILMILVGSFLIYPIIVAEAKGVIGTINRVIQLLRRSPGQIAAYIAIGVVVVIVASWIIFMLGYGGAAITVVSTLIGGGSKFADIIMGQLPGFYPYGLSPFAPLVPYRLTFTLSLAELIYAIELAGLLGILLSFPVVFILSVASATYINVAEPGEPSGKIPSPAAPVAPPSAPSEPAAPSVEGETPSGEMHCANCGAVLQPGEKYCSSCGAPQ